MRRITMSISAAAVLAVVALAGCATTGAAPTEEVAASGDFPVTLEHVYGETVIESQPERVVSIGWNTQDVAVALGVVPVGVSDFTWGTVDKYLPWFVEEVEALGSELPEILTTTESGEYDYEQILALDPDVILAPHSGVTEEEYQRLTEIAPTVAYTGVAWAADWREVTRTVGTALGQADRAEELLDETNAAIEAQAAAHPEFAGKTFLYGWTPAQGDTSLGFYTNQDAREILIEQLGFTSAEYIAEVSDDAPEFYVSVSYEELDTIDADLYIAWANTGQVDVDAMLDQPLTARWAPLADDKAYFMTEQDLAWASSQPSVLSIPWSLDRIVPELAAVLAD